MWLVHLEAPESILMSKPQGLAFRLSCYILSLELNKGGGQFDTIEPRVTSVPTMLCVLNRRDQSTPKRPGLSRRVNLEALPLFFTTPCIKQALEDLESPWSHPNHVLYQKGINESRVTLILLKLTPYIK